MQIAIIIIQVLLRVLILFLKFTIYTGTWIQVLWIAGALYISHDLNNGKKLPPWILGRTGEIVYLILLALSIIPTLMIFIKNLIRTFKKDSTFTWSDFFHDRQKSVTQPIIKSLYADSGFLFGKQKGKYITKPEYEDGHILVIGGAGSGKSSCLAIPSLNTWKERVFAIDIKGELLQKCHREKELVKVFNPLDPYAYGYDPFWALDNSDNMAQDIKDITLAIMPTPPDIKDPFWIESAQNVLNGSLTHFYFSGYTFVESMAKIVSTPIQSLLKEIMDGENILAKMFVAQLVDQKAETLAGIATELSNKIMLFATDPAIAGALGRAEKISPYDLENGYDVFIQIPEHKLEQWKPLLTIINNQFLKHFEKRSESHSKPILFLLDEFARLGKIEAILNGLATLRSKKITIAILTQSLAQLDLIYGRESRQVIADNCSYKAILKATDADTQEYFSKLVGTYDKIKKSSNANFEQYTQMGKGTGTSTTTEEKRIIKPEEFATLDKIVLLTPLGFCRAEKAPYYKDKRFTKGA